MIHRDSEFGKKIHKLAEKEKEKDVHLPPIDKKTELGRYLYNFHNTQCLHQPWYAQRYKFWGSPFEKFTNSLSFYLSAPLLVITLLLIIIPPLFRQLPLLQVLR